MNDKKCHHPSAMTTLLILRRKAGNLQEAHADDFRFAVLFRHFPGERLLWLSPLRMWVGGVDEIFENRDFRRERYFHILKFIPFDRDHVFIQFNQCIAVICSAPLIAAFQKHRK